MGTLVHLWEYDPRVRIFHEAFPESPAFATYLADRCLKLHCSVGFAHWLRCCLKAYAALLPSSTVSDEAVHRLSIDTEPELVRRMTGSLTLETKIAISLDNQLFLQLLSTHESSIKMTAFTSSQYTRLFFCAAAMLAGVEIDPRA